MAGVYPYEFAEINRDATTNYPSAAGIIKKITAEEWADMEHHTHKITELLDANGVKIGSGGSFFTYDDSELRGLVTQMQEQLTALVQENNSLKERLSTVESVISNESGFIIDYDLDQQGTQDINGESTEP